MTYLFAWEFSATYLFLKKSYLLDNKFLNWSGSDAGRWKILGVPVVIGVDNLPSPVGIGLTDLPNIGEASGPPGPPQYNKEADFKSNISLHLRVSYYI